MNSIAESSRIFSPAFDGGILDDATPADALDVLRWTAALHQPNDPLEIRLLHQAMPPLPSMFTRSVELVRHVPELRRAEAEGYSPYVSVNPRERRGDNAVSAAVAVWADGDGIEPDGLLARIRQIAGLPDPSMIVASGGGTHCYWPLGCRQSDIPACRSLMADLARVLGCDPKVGNPERVMRLPGFLNHKYNPARPCRIVYVDCARRFTWEEIRGVVPTRVCIAPPPPRPVVIDADRAGDPIRRCLAYLKKMPPAIAGQHGHDAILKTAIAIVKFGIGEADGLSILSEWNAKNSDPVFNDRDVAHKWREANRLAANSRGVMLARGAA